MASDGTIENKLGIQISWIPPASGLTYKLYRTDNAYAPYSNAAPLATVSNVSTFDDKKAVAGKEYYYWITVCTGPSGTCGQLLLSDKGIRRFPAPGGIKVTQGMYDDKIKITWNKIDLATRYTIRRELVRTPELGSMIVYDANTTFTSSTNSFEDSNAISVENTNGILLTFNYTVTAFNDYIGGDTSAWVSGYTSRYPKITDFKIENEERDGKNETIYPNVTLSFTATKFPNQYRASESSSFSRVNFGPTEPGNRYKFPLSTSGGIKKIYLQVKNSSGKTSKSESRTITFIVPPKITSMSLVQDRSNPTIVTVNHVVLNDPTNYKVSEKENFNDVREPSLYSKTTPITYRLSPGNGTKRVYFQTYNRAGSSNKLYKEITLNVR